VPGQVPKVRKQKQKGEQDIQGEIKPRKNLLQGSDMIHDHFEGISG